MPNLSSKIILASVFVLLSSKALPVAAEEPDKRFLEGERYYSQKNYAACEKSLREVLATNSKHTASLYLLGNIYLMQKRLAEASQFYRACIKYGPDTRPGQYAAMALSQIEEQQKKSDSDPEGIKPLVKVLSERQEDERRSILKAQKEALTRNQKDNKIQADKLTIEEEQQIEVAPSNQAEERNAEYRLPREMAVAQIKQDFELKRKALKEIYDRKENAINQEFKRRLAPFGAN
jgi:tetratricopeptide (TPR) repeat protein